MQWWTLVLTTALVVANAALVWATWKYARSADRQAKAMAESVCEQQRSRHNSAMPVPVALWDKAPEKWETPETVLWIENCGPGPALGVQAHFEIEDIVQLGEKKGTPYRQYVVQVKADVVGAGARMPTQQEQEYHYEPDANTIVCVAVGTIQGFITCTDIYGRTVEVASDPGSPGKLAVCVNGEFQICRGLCVEEFATRREQALSAFARGG